jgi:hypothetical protein
MPKYQLKRPPPVEVRQLRQDKLEEIGKWMNAHVYIHNPVNRVVGMEMGNTTFYAVLGDFMLYDGKAFYIEPFSEFHKKYELVEQ